jgi:outer membrane receptor protein involved in Fe transport
MPLETHSLEAGWEWRRGGASTQVTGYWRQYDNAFVDVSRYISPTVLLTTTENIGHAQSGGVEAAASGKLMRSLGFNLSGEVYYAEENPGNLGIAQARSLVSGSGKVSLDWKPDAADTFQLNASAWGRRLTAQGYRLPSGTVNLGWRRKLDEQLSLTATVADVFNTQRDRNVIDLPTLHDVYTRRQLGRVFYLGVTRRFGTSKKTEDKFDYSS